jgi:hypothetical protein
MGYLRTDDIGILHLEIKGFLAYVCALSNISVQLNPVLVVLV